MSITYNLGLPNPPNDPSNDVSGMQTNTNAVGTWTAVDHLGFNVGNGGQHKRVTFAVNSVPGGTVAPPVLFTNTQDGNGNNLPGSLAQLFFYSGTVAQGQNNFVSQSSGSVLLFGGIILKWGAVSINNTTTTITFASPFPNNCFSVIATLNTGVSQGYATVQSIAADKSSFNVIQTSTIPTAGAYYIALGN